MHPGLDYDLTKVAKKYFKGFGVVVSFISKIGIKKANIFTKRKMFHCTVSLGNIESLD